MSAEPMPDDPVAALAQAILDGRVYVTGRDWFNRDDEHRWSFEIAVEGES